MMMMTMMV